MKVVSILTDKLNNKIRFRFSHRSFSENCLLKLAVCVFLLKSHVLFGLTNVRNNSLILSQTWLRGPGPAAGLV